MKIIVRLKNLSSLTVGNSSRLTYVDIGFNDMGIPGSSIKGSMRTAISWAIREGLSNFTSCGEIRPEKIEEAHKKGVCDVCKLFGYPGHEGILRVGSIKVDRKETLTRVSINDSTNTAKKGALFKQEVVPPNSKFTFEIDLNTQDCKMLELTLLSLYFLRLWRLGRGAMIDLKIEEIKEYPKGCPSEMEKEIEKIKKELGEWLWQ
jgi:CRISPR/Cas system CSM-associated protein Csm3 (group 7 of RAMP superfamily)